MCVERLGLMTRLMLVLLIFYSLMVSMVLGYGFNLGNGYGI